MLQTISKIGPILDLFTPARPEWGVAEAAAAMKSPRSSTHALLASLAETGLLTSEGRGRYRIGWRIVELNETLRTTIDIRSHARPVMQRLVDQLGETVHLAVMERDTTLYLDKVIGNHVVTVLGARVGAHLEPHCSAAGKVLLASQDPDALDRRLSQVIALRKLTARTITDPTVLTTELEQIRRTGCAFDSGEAVPDVHCAAAPIKDEGGSVVAALSVTVPANRFLARKPELTRAVVSAAAEVSTHPRIE